MIRRSLLAIPLVLAACTPQQVATVQTDQAKIEAAIVEGCGVVNAAAAAAAPFAAVPQVGAILTFATASCATGSAVAGMVTKAVNDPSTVAWVQRLGDQLREAVAAVRRR